MLIPHGSPNSARAAANRMAKDKLRLRDPATGAYLHLSGSGTTHSPRYAWLGFLYQAEALRQRSIARGQPWPFRPIRRDLVDITPRAEDWIEGAA